MPIIAEVRFCDGCGAEISGAPIYHGSLNYCCLNCAQGERCDCALVLDDGRGDTLNLILPPFERPKVVTGR